ncbi:MAG: hypothetical protein U1E53_33175 [Dongiaceae bacterium]
MAPDAWATSWWRQAARILESAACLVKPGGRLVYATCSLLAAENEEQVARFLASAPDFAPVPVAALWPEAVGGAGPGGAGDWLRLTPARDGCDGFFVAVLGRAAKAAAADPEAGPEADPEAAPEAEEGPEAEAPAA